MLQACIDDSGWDGTSPVFVLAGYVAKAEAWDAFADEWRALLDKASVKVLKTTDIYRNRVHGTRYHGMTDEIRDELLKDLIRAVNRHALYGIVSVIPLEPYRRIFKGNFSLEALDRPYFLSFFGVLISLLKMTHRLKLDDKIDFIFDTQDSENKLILTREYERCMEAAPPSVKILCGGMPSFKKDDEFPPLQAADMLAWHARRYYSDQFSGKEPTKEQSNVFFAHMFYPEHDIFDAWTEDKLFGAANALLSKKGI